MSGIEITLMLGKVLAFFGIVVALAAISTLAERKVSAWIQLRHGPNRVGPWGLLQPLADGLKFIFKEEVVPDGANKLLFRLAPAMVATPALLAVSVIPFTFPVVIDGTSYAMSIIDVPIAMLLILALGSLQVYGILFGGWASNNKYSLLGGLRSSAQMVSYELTLILSILAVLTLHGTMNLTDMVYDRATGEALTWTIVSSPVGFISFCLFLIAAFAETNRHPFDLAEAETELVGGFHTEYSSMKFALFFIGEYAAMVTMSSLIVILFLGGPTLFGLLAGIEATWIRALLGMAVFLAKLCFFIFVFIWVRWTIPRYRWDQLMHLGWKVLLPISLANIALAGIWVVLVEPLWRT